MHPSTLLAERLALGFAGAAIFVVLCAVVHAVARVIADRSAAPRIQGASDAIVQALTGGDDAPAVAALRRLSQRRRHEVLLPFAARGGNQRSLAELARSTGAEELGRKWRRSRRAWRRRHGSRIGALLAGPTDDIARLLTDRSPHVRAAAAEWAASSGDLGAVDLLFGLIDDKAQGCSFAAMDALITLGLGTVPSLTVHLGASDPGHLVKCLKIATHIADPSLGPPAILLLEHPDPQVRAQAATSLGVTGAAAAIDHLHIAMLDPDAIVREAAVTSLGRLHAWSSVAAVSDLLTDPMWVVRRAAVFALLALGSPGTLALRAALDGDDRVASEIARLGLGLPRDVARSE
ncbi:MAG: HEAT repeat domain-containing protein [Acidimicrobiales bacterium]|nr:HEAT repeat domain-containing protein [Acidimicrobiales bacterium]